MDTATAAASDPRIERTRQVVLDAVLALVAESGYGAVTIEAVAARSGVAKSTIYRHWPGRAELVNDAFRTLQPPVYECQGGDVRSRVVQLLEDLAERTAESTWSACLPSLVDAAARDPEAREALHSRLAGRRTLVDLLTEGVASRRAATRPRRRADGRGARRTDPPAPAVRHHAAGERPGAPHRRADPSGHVAATSRRLLGRARDEPRGRRLPGVGGRTQAQHARGGAALDPRRDSRRRGGPRLRGAGVPAARKDGRRLRRVHRPSELPAAQRELCSPRSATLSPATSARRGRCGSPSTPRCRRASSPRSCTPGSTSSASARSSRPRRAASPPTAAG